jgi:hypothetical protein
MHAPLGLGVIVVAMLAAACGKARAPVEVAPPSAPPAPIERKLDGYHDALAAILDVLEHPLGFPRVDVELVLLRDRRSFEQELLNVGYPAELARSASAFAAIGGARAVLVNSGIVDRFDRTHRVTLVAHELVHSLQYRFGGGTRGNSEQWLREGFAEWVSYRVTAELGLASFDAQREELLRPLTRAPFGLLPAPFDNLVTFPQWVDAQRRSQAPLYAQAFIAAELIIEMRGVPAVIAYFERFKTTRDHQRAFTEAFEMERAEFDRAFARRWRETIARFRLRR